MKKKGWTVAGLSTHERISLAKSKSDDLINRLLQVIPLHESNRLVTYTDTPSKQIPPSFAARAFNEFQGAMHLFELTRLCALWDTPGEHRVSIPTIAALLDDKQVRHALDEETASWWRTGGALAAFEQSQVEGIRRKLSGAIKVAKFVSQSQLVRRFRDFRNSHLAHSLKGNESRLGNPKYGQERRLVPVSIEVVHRLYRGVHNSDFALVDAVRQSKRNARELWENYALTIPRR